jgi:hypothetical protein
VSSKSEHPSVYRLAKDQVGVSPAKACSSKLSTQKRQAVKAYLTKLGPELRTRYGHRDHYTPPQVRDTVLATALSIDYVCWAYLLFCSRPDFNTIHSAAGEVCDYGAMRETVAGAFFHGNADFDAVTLAGTIADGGAEALASGVEVAAEGSSWLADVDWGGLFDWC